MSEYEARAFDQTGNRTAALVVRVVYFADCVVCGNLLALMPVPTGELLYEKILVGCGCSYCVRGERKGPVGGCASGADDDEACADGT